MSFVIAGQHLIRYNDHYKYNIRATPGRSQLVYYIKESLFNYIYILAVPDPALLGFDYFPIYYILIIAIPDS